MPLQPDIVDQIVRIVGEERRVLIKKTDLLSYGYDASFGFFVPDLVCQVKRVEEVSGIAKLANREKIPITPRGNASGLSGGALPIEGGIVIDVSLWNDVLEIHRDDMIAVVSPGVITADIDRAAQKVGLMYPPDPSSSNVSTIAGNIAENSGGPRGLKYGVTKDYVLGLQVVTPEGHIIRTGGRTIKNVTGYDLTKLIVGSEGTLGIITEAILRLIPRPQATISLMAVFDDIVQAGYAITNVLTSGILPSKIEFMDQASIWAVESYRPMGLPINAEAVLFIELDGHPLAIRDEVDYVYKLMQKTGALRVQKAETSDQEEKMWKVRKLVSPAVARHKPTKISEDATVPRSQIPSFLKRLREIKDKFDIELVVFGHAGDGNLHPNILCDQRNKEEMKKVEKAVAAIFEAALDLGGTLSGEHGIGLMKKSFMPMEFDQFSLEMMKRIKQAWDPNNIMNPGKIFPKPGDRLVLR
ncbi:FAD-linked oxidase C-terminal domain-containing protein [Geobacillus sp. FSL W8-0032]|uniref:FAD-linked oxidoreductase n=1 Tax=Geobacillus icigianus TaxID=1430331 RepID=A0ABU6BDH1_9BACL|nr:MULTISPECIES: FAD-linked oxidase C-terminal domain-containing protein [Geobacillus]MEB3749749.1 putative FAD-linked oxidoreductase [Geobacillus icigianus]